MILIIGDSRSGKNNVLLNLISHQPDIDKFFLYAKDPYEAKYQLLINKCKGVSLKYCNDTKAFIEYWNNTDDLYENFEEYNINKEYKILVLFDGMIENVKKTIQL